MLSKLFKKNKKPPNPGVKKLSVALVNKVGLTDEAFETLFTPFIEMLVLAKKEEEIISSTEELLGDGYFHQKGKKPSFFVFFCLLCAEISLNDEQNQICPSVSRGEIPEVTKCVAFYTVLTHNEEGYKWALSNPDLLAEAWKYLKNSSGRYKDLLQKILHAESEILDVVDEEDESDAQHFDSSDQNEIASMFDAIAPADSVESLLDEVTEPEVAINDDEVLDDKDDSQGGDELIDITSMLKQTN